MDKSYINEVKHNTNTDIWSAGGVVLRNNSNGLEVLVCERYSEGLIALPKGKPNEGESEAQTALREVREETGAIVEIITLVKEIFYSFQSNGKTMNKKVTFYLMKSLGGNIQHHDNEFDKVKQNCKSRAIITSVGEMGGDSGYSLTREKPQCFSSGVFSQLKYEDLKKAHTETVVPVTKEDYLNVPKFSNMDSYRSYRDSQDVAPPSLQQSRAFLANKVDAGAESDTRRIYKIFFTVHCI